MEVRSVQGIVVNSIKYGENSKILTILTKELGLIGVISKGCLSEKSKLRVISNNLTYAVFHIYYKKEKLSTLINADVIDYLLKSKSNIESLGYITYLVELAKNVYKQSNDESIYDLLISGIKKIETGFNPKVITNIIEIKYLDFLGISLYLNGCVECNNANVVTISHNKGGYLCAFHRKNEPLYSHALLKMIKAYYYVDIDKISELNLSDQVINEIDAFLNTYYKEYTGLYLKSKNFLNNIKSS